MTSAPTEVFDYDVALSYAGEDRAYVQQIAEQLDQRGIRIFYDEYAAAQLWGTDLYALLDEVYRKRARFAVVFVSRYYASKPWTRHERQSAQARALTEIGPYLLPVRLDDSELPGLRPTVGYIDARNTSVERLVWLIEQKLAAVPGMTTSRPPLLRSPRTVEQKRELLAQRPDGWEHLLYAGVLWQRRQAIESKYRDHELGYARRSGQHLNDSEAMTFLGSASRDFSACISDLVRMTDPQVQERAFGPPGQPGNPALIEHIATRFVEIYEEILDIAARLRGTGVSDNMASVRDASVHMTDTPLREIRDFIDQVIVGADTIPERLASGEPIAITVRLNLTTDDEVEMRFNRELKQAMRKYKM